MKLEELDAIKAKTIAEYSAIIDELTKPRCKARAAFTKRQAADIKAGFADGVSSAVRALYDAGAIKVEA